LDVAAIDQIIAQQVPCNSQKNNVKNTPHAETVAVAAMLALSNTTNAVRCCMQDQWRQAPWHLTSLAKVMIGKQWRRGGGQGRERTAATGEDDNNSAFPQAIKWQ
jgi:hypothetical protein